jgi:hypothetical protein
LTKEITVDCQEEQVQTSNLQPVSLGDKITLNKVTAQPEAEPRQSFVPAVVLFMFNIILAASALLLYAAGKKKMLSAKGNLNQTENHFYK